MEELLLCLKILTPILVMLAFTFLLPTPKQSNIPDDLIWCVNNGYHLKEHSEHEMFISWLRYITNTYDNNPNYLIIKYLGIDFANKHNL
jgi:hypothetical protein